VKLRKPAPPGHAALTVLGFLLLSTSAALGGLLVSVLLAAVLGTGALGVSCLLLGWLAEPEGGESP
jgi:hypothetical protein